MSGLLLAGSLFLLMAAGGLAVAALLTRPRED